MEFVETPSFWCPHIDRAACNNFSTRTVELRPTNRREILPFSFSSFLSFLRTPFSFFVFFVFFPFFFSSSTNSFLFPLTQRILFGSYLISSFSSFFSSHFLFSFGNFSFLWIHIDHSVKGGNFLPFSFKPLVWCLIFSLFLLFLISLFIASSHTWLNVSHGIMPHMAPCEPFLF